MSLVDFFITVCHQQCGDPTFVYHRTLYFLQSRKDRNESAIAVGRVCRVPHMSSSSRRGIHRHSLSYSNLAPTRKRTKESCTAAYYDMTM